jgi:endoglucanase
MRLTLISGAALVVATVAAALVGLGLGLGTAPSATFDSLHGGPTSSAGPAGSPLAINGKVRVCGRKLCNQHNRPIQLRGMSTHGLQWFSRCVSDTSLDALVTDWRAGDPSAGS